VAPTQPTSEALASAQRRIALGQSPTNTPGQVELREDDNALAWVSDEVWNAMRWLQTQKCPGTP
jgi:hypothetical protein